MSSIPLILKLRYHLLMQTVSILGSSYELNDANLESALISYANVLNKFKILYCGTKYGFLKKLISLINAQNKDITSYLCPEYADDINLEVKNQKLFPSKIERQSALINDPDAIVIFPGGFGTTAELFDILDRIQSSICTKDIILVNEQNYWGDLLRQIDKMQQLGLIKKFQVAIIKNHQGLQDHLCQDIN